LLESTADNLNGDPKQGHGRVNAYRALAVATNDAALPTHPTGFSQFVAFAYDSAPGGRPHIVDLTYPYGSPVSPAGAFQIGDVPAAVTSYHVAVWYYANGAGIVDAGDQIAVGPNACNASAASCSPGAFTVMTVPAGYTLP